MFERFRNPKKTSAVETLSIEAKADRLEHLAKGVDPIMACVGTRQDFTEELSRDTHPFYIDDPSLDADNVDYYGEPEELRGNGMKNPASRSYVISGLNSHNKFSEGFLNCTSLVVTGIDKDTGENISILSHQDPEHFLREYREEFAKDLTEALQELQKQSSPSTIDAVITGGNFFTPGDSVSTDVYYRKNYTESIEFLTEQVKGSLGFDPLVIAGPKTIGGGDMIFYQTSKRRLYLIRPNETKGKRSNSSYEPSNLQNEARNWGE
jgi:hypothetical protein